MRRNIYWINPFMRLVRLLIISAAKTAPKIRIWPRRTASRALKDNLSAKDIINRHTKHQKGIYLFNNSPINFQIALTVDFVYFFVLSWAAFEFTFLISLSLDSTKRVPFLPCKVITMKGWNSYIGFFPLALFLFSGNSRRKNMEVKLGLLCGTDQLHNVA